MSQKRTPAANTFVLIVFAILAILAVPALADPASPFTITNIDSPDPVASGAELVYTITVVNTGGSKTTEVVMTDQLNGVGGIGVPPQLQITSSRGSCTQSATLVTCSAGTIEGGGSWTVTIRGIVIAPNGTSINNTASVTGTRSAQNFTSTATAVTLVNNGSTSELPDLTITKNGPTTVAYGAQMTYSLIVNNQGLANATDVVVVDTVPMELTNVIAQPLGTTSLFTCNVVDHTVTCSGGAINQGANATITITAIAPTTDAVLTNTASVDPFNAIAESNELNNTSALVNTQVMKTPPPPPLSITKTDATDPIVPGDTEVYTVTVKNNAATRADDVVIVDGTQGLEASTLTATFEVTDGTIGNFGGCTVAAPQAKCMARTLNPGGTIVMIVSGKVIASAGSTLLNTSTVTGNIKNTGYSATATEKTTVKPSIDLTVTVADNPDPVCARSWNVNAPLPVPLTCRGGLEYTVTPGNSGINPAGASNVVVRMPLPPGVVFDYITVPAHVPAYPDWTCPVPDATNVLTCTTANIGPESIAPFMVMTVAPPVVGPIALTATVDPANAIFEADETNNTFTQGTQVVTGIDLTTKVVDDTPGFDPIATSGTQTYTITVWNEGTQDATGIRLRQTLPSGTRFRDVIADPAPLVNHNFTCSYANMVIECVGGMLKGTASNNDPLIGGPGVNPATPRDTATIYVRVFAQPFEGTMHTEVRVDPMNEIPEAIESNNIAVQDTVVGSFVSGNGGFNQLTILKEQIFPTPVGSNIARNAKMTWKITVGNTGTDKAVGVTVRDFLPAGARYIEATGTNMFNCNQVGGHIDCAGGEIASAGTATITVSAFAPDTPAKYTNQAIVDPDNTIPEGDELENESQAEFTVANGGIAPFYDLTVTKTPTKPSTNENDGIARNAMVVYKIEVKNVGSDPVIGVTVRDVLPAGARYIEATGLATDPHQFICSHTDTTIDCTTGQLGSGESGTINVTMFAPDTPGEYTNVAIADPNNTVPEGDEENNRSSVKLVVVNGGMGPYNDLKVEHTSATPNTYPLGPITYVLKISNLGDHDAQNVALHDVLPPGVTFVRADQTGNGAPFTCSESNGVIDCSGAMILANDFRTLTIKATAPNYLVTGIPPSQALRNVATVDPNNTVPEGDESNNTSTSGDLTVTSRLDLTTSQSGPTSASQSDTTDYEVTVTNTPQDGTGQIAQGVVMVDTLPPGLIPLAVTAGTGNNWGCQIFENAVNFVRCVGDLDKSGAGAEVKIKITVFITAENGRALDNTACVDPDNLIVESDELNNCSDHGTYTAPPVPKRPEIQVTKGADNLAVTPGAPIVYTITVNNQGDWKAQGWNGVTGLTVRDELPSEVSYVNFESTNGWTCTGTTTITCHDDGSGLAQGANAEVKIHATVNPDAKVPVVNQASADTAIADDDVAQTCHNAGTCADESKIDNNTAQVTSSIGSSGLDFAISSITDVPDPVAASQPLKYTTVAVNGGTAPATGVVVRLTIPTLSEGAKFDKADGSNGFNCAAPSGNTIDCTGDMPAGGTTVITASFNIQTSNLAPDITLTAEIDPDNHFTEIDEGNNKKSQTTTISQVNACTSCVDLVAVELLASPDPANPGDTVNFAFDYQNTGDLPTMLDNNTQDVLWLVTNSDVPLAIPTISFPPNTPTLNCTANYFFVNTIVLTQCKGTIAPATGNTVTLSFGGVGGTFITTKAYLDPSGLVTQEINKSNNNIEQSVAIYPGAHF